MVQFYQFRHYCCNLVCVVQQTSEALVLKYTVTPDMILNAFQKIHKRGSYLQSVTASSPLKLDQSLF